MELESVAQVRASVEMLGEIRRYISRLRQELTRRGYSPDQVKRGTDPVYTFALEILEDLREAKRRGIWPARS